MATSTLNQWKEHKINNIQMTQMFLNMKQYALHFLRRLQLRGWLELSHMCK